MMLTNCCGWVVSLKMMEESLHYHFEQNGPVVSVEVMRDRNTGDFCGFLFCGIYAYISNWLM
jgi:RNA recognition motif-containing protein